MFDAGNHGTSVQQLFKKFLIIKRGTKNISLFGARMKYRQGLKNANHPCKTLHLRCSGAARTNEPSKTEPQTKIVNGLNS